MKRKHIKIMTCIALAAVLALSATGFAFADDSEGSDEPITTAFGGWFGGQFPGSGGQSSGTTGNASEPSEIVTSSLTSNSAEKLTAGTLNAQTIVMSDSNNSVKISSSGTYIVTGTCSNGNLAVKKGTKGVVLILKDLDLTSTTGATLSLNKGTEVKDLQKKLLALGYTLPKYGADGDFGKETEAAVKAFQQDNGLTADGVAGKKTWEALENAKPMQLYTVTIPGLMKHEAEALVKNYAGASYREE